MRGRVAGRRRLLVLLLLLGPLLVLLLILLLMLLLLGPFLRFLLGLLLITLFQLPLFLPLLLSAEAAQLSEEAFRMGVYAAWVAASDRKTAEMLGSRLPKRKR